MRMRLKRREQNRRTAFECFAGSKTESKKTGKNALVPVMRAGIRAPQCRIAKDLRRKER